MRYKDRDEEYLRRVVEEIESEYIDEYYRESFFKRLLRKIRLFLGWY